MIVWKRFIYHRKKGAIKIIINPAELIDDFNKIAIVAGIVVPIGGIKYEVLPAPHLPPCKLPRGKMAIYIFLWNSQCFKVGKVGIKSHARYNSQHYNPLSSKSNLAKSILIEAPALGLNGLDNVNVGDWIKQNTDRINFIVDGSLGVAVLNLFESFLQCRLRPRFEGFKSQN